MRWPLTDRPGAVAALAVALTLAACGGSGGDPPQARVQATPNPAGVVSVALPTPEAGGLEGPGSAAGTDAEAVIMQLHDALWAPGTTDRQEALDALVDQGSAAAATAVTSALDHPQRRWRLAAVDALEDLLDAAPAAARDGLLRASVDPDPTVAARALEVLMDLQEEGADSGS